MKYWFIVHDEESFNSHPNLIGFFSKMDLDGKPLRDVNGQIMPIDYTGKPVVFTTNSTGSYEVEVIFKDLGSSLESSASQRLFVTNSEEH